MPKHTELAAATLTLINQARVPASDNDLMLALTIRGWLKDIASGKLEVVEIPEAPEAPKSNVSNKDPVPC